MEVALKLISGQFNPIQLNFSRFLVGGLVLIPFAVRELKKRGRKLDGKALGSFALLGLMGIAVSMSLYQLSVTRIQASVVGVLFSSNPVFVTLFAFLLLHETISKNQIAGLVLDVAGIVLIIQPWHLRLDALGVVYVLLATLLFALYGVCGKRQCARFGGIVVTCFGFLFGAAEMIAIAGLTHIPALSAGLTAAGLDTFASIPFFTGYTLTNLPIVLFIYVGVTGIGFTCYFLSMEVTSAQTTSLVFFFKPALAPLLAFLVLHEAIPGNMLAGIACILCGSLVSILPGLLALPLVIRTTEEETEVVPNLMIGFGIDEVQADYVAEIKLRHLNREYILKRTGEIEQLENDIADLKDILEKPARIRKIIIKELTEVAKKYAQPRRSEILYDLPEEESGAEEETIPDYPVTVFFTREGYLKKIPPQSLRTAGAHKLKEGDEIIQQVETRNNVEALFFTDKQQVYKVRLNELEDGKVAQMGIFIPGRLGMDEGENILAMVITGDYAGFMLFFFESGKCAKIPLASYATKLNRRKLLKAYCDKEPLAKMVFLPEETELAIRTSAGRMLLVGTAQISAKATRDSQGVAVVTLKKNQHIASVVPAETLELANPHRYRVRSLPATGALVRAEDEGEQLSLL